MYAYQQSYTPKSEGFKKPDKKAINLMLLGKAGTGKSSTGNTIINREEFITSDNKGCAPPKCHLECYESEDTLVRVVDTPGLMGTMSTPDEVFEIMFGAMSLCSEGFNAFIYVMAYGDRFTQEDKDMLTLLKECFGENFIRDFCVVVVTKGDNFITKIEKNGKSRNFADWLSKQVQPMELKALFHQCKNRVVLFYNVGERYQTEKEKARTSFMNIVGSLTRIYTLDHFRHLAINRANLVSHLKCNYQIQDHFSLIKQNLLKCISVNKEMKTAVTTEEIKRTNLQMIEHILKAKESIEKILFIMRMQNQKVGSVEKLLSDVHNVLANIKITEKPSHEILEDMLNSLLKNVDSIKNKPNFNLVFISSSPKKKMSRALHAAIRGAIGGFLGVAALIILFVKPYHKIFPAEKLILECMIGSVCGFITTYMCKRGYGCCILFFFLFLILYNYFRY